MLLDFIDVNDGGYHSLETVNHHYPHPRPELYSSDPTTSKRKIWLMGNSLGWVEMVV